MTSIQTNKIDLSVTEKIETLISLFDNEFMRPQILTQITVSQIDDEHGGSRWTPQGEEYLEKGEYIEETFKNASLCRLSASGYMDCTDWELCLDENDILDWIEREAAQVISTLIMRSL